MQFAYENNAEESFKRDKFFKKKDVESFKVSPKKLINEIRPNYQSYKVSPNKYYEPEFLGKRQQIDIRHKPNTYFQKKRNKKFYGKWPKSKSLEILVKYTRGA